MAVTMDENGDYQSMERFLPNENFSSAIDMDFGPDGALYVLEYGSAWFRGNANSRLIKIEYNAGNRKPNVTASADRLAGAVPLTVNFSSEGTNDYDDYDLNQLAYQWTISSEGKVLESFNRPNPSFTFDQAGVYEIELVVTDTKGAQNSQKLEVVAGNDIPEVKISMNGINQSFWFGEKELDYQLPPQHDHRQNSAEGAI